jgi:hypothetical protein
MRDPTVNAFAMPNGSIYVNTGLLAMTEMTFSPWTMLSSDTIPIGIVDAHSGDVLAYTLTSAGSDIGKADRKLVEVITKSLKKFPSETPAE